MSTSPPDPSPTLALALLALGLCLATQLPYEVTNSVRADKAPVAQSPRPSRIQYESGTPNIQHKRGSTPVIAFDQTQRDFGRILQGTKATLRFRFRNLGGAPLRITRVRPGCGCTAVRLSQTEFAPGSGAAITATFDSRARGGAEETSVNVETNDPLRRRIVLRLRGFVVVPPRPKIVIEPEQIDLGRLDPVSPRSLSFVVRNAGAKRLEFHVFRLPPGLRLDQAGPWSLPSGARLVLHASLGAQKRGSLDQSLFFASNDPERGVAGLGLSGYLPPSPGPRLVLGRGSWRPRITPQKPARLVVPIWNEGTSTLELGPARLLGQGIRARLSATSLAPGGVSELQLTVVSPSANKRRVSIVDRLGKEHGGIDILPRVRASTAPLLQVETKLPAREALRVKFGAVRSPRVRFLLKIGSDQERDWPARLFAPPGFSITRQGGSQGSGAQYLIEGEARARERRIQQDLIVALPGLGGLRIKLSGRIVPGAGPRLRLDREQIDFGLVASDAARDITLRISNEGSSALELRSRRGHRVGEREGLSLGPFVPQSLAPGESTNIVLHYRGRQRLGPLRASLAIESNDPQRPHLLVPIAGLVVPPAGTKRLRVLYASDEAGELEPCGCGGVEQLGGLPRYATAVRQARRVGPSLLISGGDLCGGAGELYRRRGATALSILGELGADALVPGELDLALGVERLGKLAKASGVPIVLSNLESGNLGAASIVIERGGIRLGIAGVLEPGFISSPAQLSKLRLGEPITMLRPLVAKLREQVQLVVVVAHTGLRLARKLAEAVEGIDLLIVGHGEEAIESPLKIGGTLIVANSDRGRRLGIADLYMTGKVRAFQGEQRRLDAKIKDDPRAQGRLMAYRRALRTMPPTPVATPASAPRYAGAGACADCHEAEAKLWSETEHARALASLARSGSDYDARCTLCHSVGQGKPHGFQRRDLSPTLGEVRCESCHGPAAGHAEDPRSADNPRGISMPEVGQQSCLPCHNAAHSPRFRWSSYWKRVAHGGKPLLALWDADGDGKLSTAELGAMKSYRAATAAQAKAARELPASEH